MGGLVFLIVAVVVSFLVALFTQQLTNNVGMILFILVLYGLVGFLDDFLKVFRKINEGLNPKQKLALQLLGGVIFYLFYERGGDMLSVFGYQVHLGIFYIFFALFWLVGFSNAVNLTDGLDGLAIGPMVVAGLVFSVYIYITGHVRFAQYLQLEYISGVGEVAVFCSALAGAGLGFLWFNAYPAQMFMGDVGSLGLGGVLAFLAVLCKQELLLLIVGGLFVAETLSVILQVSYFKASGGKRIFRMAPLHHHYEMKGIPESKIIIRFWIISVMLGLIALSALKLR